MPTSRDVPEPEEWDDEDEEGAAATPETDLAETVPEADALDQTRAAAPGEQQHDISPDPEIPEADAIEQATEVPYDPDEDRHTT